MRWILGLYPQPWRDRYGDEMAALLDDLPLSPVTALDLLVGALAAHIDQLLVLVRRRRGVPPVTREQVVSLALGVGWLVPWLVLVHASLAAMWVPVVGAAFLELAVTKPSRTELVLSLVAAVGLGGLLGHAWGGLACGLAAWAGWSAWDPVPRTGLLGRLILVLLTLTVLVMGWPHWWPVLPAAVGMGVLGLVEGHRPLDVTQRRWWGLGLAVTLAAVGLALMVYGAMTVAAVGLPLWWPVAPLAGGIGILAWTDGHRRPSARRGARWKRGVALALVGLGLVLMMLSLLGVLVAVLPHWWAVIPLALGIGMLAFWEGKRSVWASGGRHWGRRAVFVLGTAGAAVVVETALAGGVSWGFLSRLGADRTCGLGPCEHVTRVTWMGSLWPHGPLSLPLLGGLVLLGVGIFGRRWLLHDWEPSGPAIDAAELSLERRRLTPPGEPPSSLRYTRRVIYEHLHQAAHGPYRARPDETLREWAARVYGASALPAVVLYEEVRYGDMPDTRARAAAVGRHWPARPRADLAAGHSGGLLRASGRLPRVRLAYLWAGLVILGVTAAGLGETVPAAPRISTGPWTRTHPPYHLVAFGRREIPPPVTVVDPNPPRPAD